MAEIIPINAQRYINYHYPPKQRKQITELYISRKDLQGNLDLSDFINLKKIDLSNNKLASDLSFLTPATNLEEINLANNNFTGSLDYLSGMKKLKEFNISNTDINEVN